jgi:Protein of unknown function (DUF4236)
MPFRFRRSFKIAPGIRLNLSKLGVSTSIGERGAHVTIGHGKVRETVGLPGTGLSYTTTQPSATKSATKSTDGRRSHATATEKIEAPPAVADQRAPPPQRRLRPAHAGASVILVVFILAAIAHWLGWL